MRTIKARLLTSLLLLMTALVAIGGAGWYASRVANDGLQTVFVDRVKPLRDLKVVSDLYAVNIVDTAHKVRDGSVSFEAGEQLVARAMTDSRKAWDAYAATSMDAQEKALAAGAARAMQAGQTAVAQLTDVLRRKDKAALTRFAAETLYPAIDPISETLGKLVELQIEAAFKEYDRAQAAFANARLGMGAIMLGAFAVFAFALWTVLRGVVAPLGAITGAMQRLAKGELDLTVPGAARQDEVGTMAASVEVFRQNALETERMRAGQREQEARFAAERKASMHALADQFAAAVGGIVDAVASSATELEAAASTLTHTATDAQRIATGIAAASGQASANVQSVASATEELASSVGEIGRQVQESSDIAGQAVKQAERTDARIAELSQAAARIGDVVKLITAVAEQTNLLALNATIEAARAGEAGRGFAVVASEVKALAAQTAKATEEIGTQIASMQGATRDSVGAIKEIGGTIGRISEIAGAIAAAVEEQGAATQEISRNVQQAAQGTAQVAHGIGDVNRGASETGSASTQVLASAQQLSSQGNKLKLEVDKFLATVRAA
jgi:methyl-accepting chemotaxis protein